jgi:hypothetical protein
LQVVAAFGVVLAVAVVVEQIMHTGDAQLAVVLDLERLAGGDLDGGKTLPSVRKATSLRF